MLICRDLDENHSDMRESWEEMEEQSEGEFTGCRRRISSA